NTGASFSLKTDKKGGFLKIGAHADVYHVTVTKDGQPIGDMANVTVTYGENQPLKIATARAVSAPAAPAGSITLNPAEKQALKQLQEQAAAAPKDDKAVRAKLQAAQAAVAAGNCDQAIALLTEVTRMDPMSDAAWGQLGFCYGQSGKNDLAVPALEKAVAISPSFGNYHQNLAISYAKTGKMDDALAELASAAQADPVNTTRYQLFTGLLLAQEGKSEAAVAIFDKVIAADPNLADAYYFKGRALMDQAKQADGKVIAPPGTAEAFKKYLQLQPNGPRAPSARELLSRLGS
ncbi:MAG TPA: tetratricopeptide repeat protein, partial [Terriglobales bacterium]|nr:tetratricopeptide repeat protein [Terriglobales bacterium]